ncbi:hypothetical protein PBY51_015558 [Eleginops maclovinus]|uniref:Uncharacterized protein n=1 Tax=Eleginops maclovinus TaxID=56733 RepID=A0AAN7XNX1_ELEMC|nr:hypothetical protein PBY51_015558 [Eleginops maclovinus]
MLGVSDETARPQMFSSAGAQICFMMNLHISRLGGGGGALLGSTRSLPPLPVAANSFQVRGVPAPRGEGYQSRAHIDTAGLMLPGSGREKTSCSA